MVRCVPATPVKGSDGMRIIIKGAHETYGIEQDTYGYTVQRRVKTKNGEVVWRTLRCAHFSSLRGACRRVLELGLSEAEEASVIDLIEHGEQWTERIEQAVSGQVRLENRPPGGAPCRRERKAPALAPAPVQEEHVTETASSVPEWLRKARSAVQAKTWQSVTHVDD